MDETLAFREVFSMISYLIGPQKWIALAKNLKIYEEEKFEDEISKLHQQYRKVPDRIWNCFMAWRLSVGPQVKVEHIIDGLHAIEVHWLANNIQQHLETEGFLISRVDSQSPKNLASLGTNQKDMMAEIKSANSMAPKAATPESVKLTSPALE